MKEGTNESQRGWGLVRSRQWAREMGLEGEMRVLSRGLATHAKKFGSYSKWNGNIHTHRFEAWE